jgi:hypothetical protein
VRRGFPDHGSNIDLKRDEHEGVYPLSDGVTDVRFSSNCGAKAVMAGRRLRATFGLMRRNKKRLQYRPSIINIRDIFGGY